MAVRSERVRGRSRSSPSSVTTLNIFLWTSESEGAKNTIRSMPGRAQRSSSSGAASPPKDWPRSISPSAGEGFLAEFFSSGGRRIARRKVKSCSYDFVHRPMAKSSSTSSDTPSFWAFGRRLSIFGKESEGISLLFKPSTSKVRSCFNLSTDSGLEHGKVERMRVCPS